MPPLNQQLKKGLGTVRNNVSVLMQQPQTAPRKKAISTIAKKNNISRSDAQFRQAVAISKNLARKS